MKLEDMCLTIEQARELKELGIDFSNSIYEFVETYDEYEDCNEVIICEREYVTIEREILPTLTVNEMLEMLPSKIKIGEYYYYLRIERGDVFWCVTYYNHEISNIYLSRTGLLRNVLFETIEELTERKLI